MNEENSLTPEETAALWETANRYEFLCLYFNVDMKFDRDGGQWPYHFDREHLAELEKRFETDKPDFTEV